MTSAEIEALEAEAEAEEAAAAAVELTEDEKRACAALARRDKAREERAVADKARRDIDLAGRLKAAQVAAGKRYLVRGLDLVAFFPSDAVPPPEQLPGAGVLVIRSPDPIKFDAANAEIEHKKSPMSKILADLLCESVIYPDTAKDPAEGMKLRAFCDAYKGAAALAGDEVYKLGGAKAKADKRGSS